MWLWCGRAGQARRAAEAALLFLQDKVGDSGDEVVCTLQTNACMVRCSFDSDKGACGQCSVGNCTIAYHPLCAVRNGIQVRFLDDTVREHGLDASSVLDKP